tara:strand:+ start:3130 stop:4551 length:1422 start_codon:yes stop_codon:yes gene_type:complete
MNGGSSFNEILTAATRCWHGRNVDEFLLSLAIPIKEVDPLVQLPVLADKEQFRFLWDGVPGLCIAAAGQCQHLDLVGPQRFDVAQRFCDETLSRVVDATAEAPMHTRVRILLSFSFFDQITQRESEINDKPAIQAVLPRWQLTNLESSVWLRLNAVVNHESEARELVEHLWIMSENLCYSLDQLPQLTPDKPLIYSSSNAWQDCYQPALSRGIELVNSGEIDKLVLAVRQSIVLLDPFNPLLMLARLREQQASSCRFLWETSKNKSFFGASPERLLSLHAGQIRIDALAGTANKDDNGEVLLRSDKNLREHELVVENIIHQLIRQGLEPFRPNGPQLAYQGHLLHLHTPIVASARGKPPLHLVGALHPTPAVAGLPRRQALNWLRALEPFDRGSYAAPIGWIDSGGNAEFRVAIRCGYSRGNSIDLIAGAGLVKGSTIEGELQEVALKFDILANQLDLGSTSQATIFNRRSMT